MQNSKMAAMDGLRRAITAHQAGQLEQAEFHYRAVLDADRRNVDAMQMLGVLLGQTRRFAEAEEVLRRALKQTNARAELHGNLARVLVELGRHNEALDAADRAIAINRNMADGWLHRGVALQHLQRSNEAIESFDRALALAPDLVPALLGRSIALMYLRRVTEAIRDCDRILVLRPQNAKALITRGFGLMLQQDAPAALAAFERALAIAPDTPEALDGRMQMLGALGRRDEAREAADRLLRLRPDFPFARGRRLHLALEAADWRHHAEDVALIREGIDNAQPVATPLDILSVIEPADVVRRCAQTYVEAQHPASATPLSNGEDYGHARIRIGYVSADFGDHAVSQLMVETFENHDRARFEIVGISLHENPPSELGRRVAGAMEGWVACEGRDSAAIARTIRDLEIDIAVDLNGHTLYGRPDAFAQRPAPVQVNYLGFAGTSGAPYFDYIIGDAFGLPPAHESGVSEQIVRLPDVFQANPAMRPEPTRPPTRREAGLPEDAFVFCVLNATYKITPEMFAVWMRLMRETEGSVLWHASTRDDVAANLRQAAAAQGIDPARIVVAGRTAYADYLARFRLADLALDTYPCNGGSTSADTLWAGLPMVTLAGTSYASRMSGSLLHALGLPELVTHSVEDYAALALRLTQDHDRRRDLHRRLLAARTASPVFDPARFCRHLEAAFTEMHARRLRGEAPQSFDVPPL